MDPLLLLSWLRYIVVRLFVFCGILTIVPILLLFLLEPLVYLFRLLQDYLPSSLANRAPTRQPTIALANIASTASPDGTGTINPTKGIINGGGSSSAVAAARNGDGKSRAGMAAN
ncbi:hypothetical protein Dda_1873 [Drechslerella dactyloides]|uniref:Uncharacterized protein n=1 Tax=Drechslerella dactyloides TaxID=74499 RepID=A0AAD6J4U2_DREDA|nr:hypothetical protein Dda_1873 [Drechslerella dactyloides]